MPARPRRRLLSLLRAPVRPDVASHEVLAEVGVALAQLAFPHLLLAHLAFPAHLLFPVERGLLLLRRLLADAVCDAAVAGEGLGEARGLFREALAVEGVVVGSQGRVGWVLQRGRLLAGFVLG